MLQGKNRFENSFKNDKYHEDNIRKKALLVKE